MAVIGKCGFAKIPRMGIKRVIFGALLQNFKAGHKTLQQIWILKRGSLLECRTRLPKSLNQI